ncbi:hypothetical protein Osc7112_5584 [Oscillatoria nigro-viridis PCC 7112]|uniref:Uncharacterized protein n=1 Tax=Phormidium nigroviride PCC 7112 TaxID=179408 RepID=K9VQN4_9CYAN|nr:hypothetical protein Osc7112_5584 [Oscillatoria nigro-viridis PCC 7112]
MPFSYPKIIDYPHEKDTAMPFPYPKTIVTLDREMPFSYPKIIDYPHEEDTAPCP